MSKICLSSCGLGVDSQGRLQVLTPGMWPYAGTPSSNGHPIWCDTTGLWAEPGTSGPVVFTSSGTLSKSQVGNAKSLKFRVQNGGPGGGGAAGNSAGQSSAGGGASGGACAERTIAVSALTFPLQVNIGGAGAGGTTGTDGSVVGTQSSVIDANGAGATLCTPGAAPASAAGHGGAPGTAVGGCGAGSFNVGPSGGVFDLLLNGDSGSNAVRFAATVALGGTGGGAPLGGGGEASSFTGGVGQNGQGWGGGGAGASNGPSHVHYVGGRGAPGIVIVELRY